MKPIAHRGLFKTAGAPNSLSALEAALAAGFGVETDLRSYQGTLYLSHDPIMDSAQAPRFDRFLAIAEKYPGLTSFINIKEDGLLPALIGEKARLEKLGFVFFDMSVPQLVQYSKTFSPKQLCTRFSDFEPVPSGLDVCDWIWVDGFSKNPDRAALASLVRHGKKLAIVSPELHGRPHNEFWTGLSGTKEIGPDSVFVCTDFPQQLREEFA